ncbi:transcription termination factor Rho [Aquihabitans sp. G128]|uniref:transcription termination factor Rho n=1 Tax=Aquihabitans sp. G128 TaxID=2849779 RepID=UPI001C229CB9|nr:transcription termination factor Rho [Aquihabitans sp. G128]QXC63180.1 transcription termination factor Rho [Aquihabitans sp. G128]
MSVGQDFDPSLLERKDRAELVAIATSLGGKPPSRAKKAEIVGLILQLVGAEPGGSGAAPALAFDAPAAEEADGADPVATEAAAPSDAPAADGAERDGDADDGAPTTPPPAGRGGGRGPNSSPAPQGGGAGGAQGRDGQDRNGGSPPQGRPQGGNQQGRDGGAQQGGNQARSGQGSGPQQGGGNPGGAQQGGGNQGGGGQQGSSPQAEEAGPGNQADPQPQGDGEESGNRRRRRRGRDRDRRPDQADDQAFLADPVDVEGLVDLRDEGYGFLRIAGYLPSRDDAYISVKQARQFGLRKGDTLKGKSRPANRNEKNPALLQVDAVNGFPVGELPARPDFDDLTPLFPDERIRLEQREFPENMTARIIDLIAPIGKGQRGLIVSPPKAGKTTVMKQVVRAIERNHPEVHLIVLLVDERPEEVTDMKRWLINGEVAASTFDRPTEEHTAVAELVLERAKRLVEAGKDVAIVLDGITRLARAYNLAAPANGRTMAGGIDTGALYPPKKFFGAARNVEEGGSLTILATALVETGTRMDEVIFEEFKGTGNMELKLDRRLADRRIYPAIDVDASSTRHEELLFDRKQLAQVFKLRRVLSALKDESGSSASGLEMLTDRLLAFKTNDAFLDEIAKAPQ